jgi:pimeloyl-ACP methyl ester carboxylesterase
MSAAKFLTRVPFFLVVLALAVVSWDGKPVSSQPQGEGGFESYVVPGGPLGGGPLSPTSPGHVDDWWVFRNPPIAGYMAVADKIVFTKDDSGGLAIAVSSAEHHDKWTWSFYFPGNPPGGGVPDKSCWAEIRAPGDPGNPYSVPALATNCTPSGFVEVYAFPGPCPCSFGAWIGPLIAGYPAESEVGTWTAIVDYTDPGGVPTPAVAVDNIYLMHTPAVLLIHGYMGSCNSLDQLESAIEQELAVTQDRVGCYDYDSRKGVEPAARAMAGYVRDVFRPSLGMGPDQEVDLVGHSMGGLVARYYYQFRWGSPDGPIGSISMLGAPNEGVWIAELEKFMCAPAGLFGILGLGACFFIDWADLEDDLFKFDPDSDGVDDMTPGSEMLHWLNDDFTLPLHGELPEYRAHAGGDASEIGAIVSHSTDNDCLVSVDSVDGPGSGEDAVFAPVLLRYETLTHGAIPLPGCDPPSLTDSASVVDDLIVTIKGSPTGEGAAGGPPPAEPAQSGAGIAMAATAVDFVLPSQSKTHQISVPSGLDSAAFVVFWRDNDAAPDLAFTLRRPGGGAIVSPTDPDVIEEIAVTGDPMFHVLMRGFVMSTPQADNWEVTVQGVSVPDGGQPYLVALMPDSQVDLTADAASPMLDQGEPEVITATLIDGTTAIAASPVLAQITTPAGTQEPVTLRDDGTGGDQVAGDLTYSGTFTSTADCGVYGVLVTATGDSSEGTVTRQQLGFFQAHVPGDAVRDPCNPDDDEDLLTDADELDIYLTDPLDSDTDADGCADSEELAQANNGQLPFLPGETGPYDPLDYWDFYDVPVPAVPDPTPNGARNGLVSMGDVLAVLMYVGTCNNCAPTPSGVDYDSLKDGDWNGDTVLNSDDEVGRRYDRSPSPLPNPPWEAGPPSGAVAMSDVLAVLPQVGLDCHQPPPPGEGGSAGASGDGGGMSSGAAGGAVLSAPNAMAVDAIPGGGVNQWRWWSGGSPFDIAVVVTAAGQSYAGYDLALSYDDQILQFVPMADLDGNTVLESWTYSGLGGMSLKATVVPSDLDGDTVLDEVVGGAARSSGAAGATGTVITARFRCIGNGTSPVHLVSPGTTTLGVGGATIDTTLAGANVWCWGIQ